MSCHNLQSCALTHLGFGNIIEAVIFLFMSTDILNQYRFHVHFQSPDTLHWLRNFADLVRRCEQSLKSVIHEVSAQALRYQRDDRTLSQPSYCRSRKRQHTHIQFVCSSQLCCSAFYSFARTVPIQRPSMNFM